jgi:16S rRNA (cytosine967-C5)-methyltransferase
MSEALPGLQAREAAVHLLNSWERKPGPATPLLDPLRRKLESPRDRAFLTNLIFTTFRWLGWADAVLDVRLTRGLSSVSPILKNILRLGIVQLYKIKGVEPHAVIYTSVELARSMAKDQRHTLVNAVLRGLQRKPPTDEELCRGNEVEDLARLYSHPSWILKRWEEQYGREAALDICRWNNTPPSLSFRIRGDDAARESVLRELKEDGLTPEPAAVLPGHYRLKAGYVPEESRWVREGRIVIQDESEALVPLLWDPETWISGAPVLDACAAPGTKTGRLAEISGKARFVLGCDLTLERIRLVAETARRLNLPNIRCIVADATKPPVASSFGAVLVDAPCSNLGVLCRRPDARWLRRPDEIGDRAALQREIVARAIELLRPGGFLLYSVCSLEPEETDDILVPFTRPEGGSLEWAEPAISLPDEFRGGPGRLRIPPGRKGLEGVFAGLLKKI